MEQRNMDTWWNPSEEVRHILDLRASGIPVKKIASDLGIPVTRVEYHVYCKNVRKKEYDNFKDFYDTAYDMGMTPSKASYCVTIYKRYRATELKNFPNVDSSVFYRLWGIGEETVKLFLEVQKRLLAKQAVGRRKDI